MKKQAQKSIFNLIEIFRKGKTKMAATFNEIAHCQNKSLHDYYCDAEQPYTEQSKTK